MLAMDKKDVGHEDANPITQMIWANTLLTIFLAIPSLSVMVLLRRKIGYRTLQGWMLVISSFCLIALGGSTFFDFFDTLTGGHFFNMVIHHTRVFFRHFAVLGVAAIMIGLAIYHHRTAWTRILHGERWHTKSRGVSHFSAVLPFQDHIIQRFIEPAVCFLVGLIFMSFSTPLGLWFVFSGGCLMMLEGIIYDLKLNRTLDQLDALVESEVAAENDAFSVNSKQARLEHRCPRPISSRWPVSP